MNATRTRAAVRHIAALAVIATACQRSDGSQEPPNTATDAGEASEQDQGEPVAFRKAREQGLAMNGYKDTAALKRVVENYFQAAALPKGFFDENLARELGVDFQALKELSDLALLNGLEIYRVEMIPGLGSDLTPLDPTDTGGQGNAGAFAPGFPSRGSLVGQGAVSRVQTQTGDRRTGSSTFRDGSTWTITRSTDKDGNVSVHETTRDGNGDVEYYHGRIYNSAGEQTADKVIEHDNQPSQAEEARRRTGQRADDDPFAPPNATGDGETGGGNEGTDGKDTGDGDQEKPGKLDQYQPAEGGAGSFCPLTIEICRRGLEKALASFHQVRVGMVRVNPGDPDDAPPSAPRLVFDPEDLVINPDPNAASPREGRSPARFRMDIPVWVNPPGPSEGPS